MRQNKPTDLKQLLLWVGGIVVVLFVVGYLLNQNRKMLDTRTRFAAPPGAGPEKALVLVSSKRDDTTEVTLQGLTPTDGAVSDGQGTRQVRVEWLSSEADKNIFSEVDRAVLEAQNAPATEQTVAKLESLLNQNLAQEDAVKVRLALGQALLRREPVDLARVQSLFRDAITEAEAAGMLGTAVFIAVQAFARAEKYDDADQWAREFLPRIQGNPAAVQIYVLQAQVNEAKGLPQAASEMYRAALEAALALPDDKASQETLRLAAMRYRQFLSKIQPDESQEPLLEKAKERLSGS
jgi:tetratricopeptide (TPR) repeat protein